MIWLTLVAGSGWLDGLDSVEVDTSNVETNQKMLPAADGRLGALKEFHLHQSSFQKLSECKYNTVYAY